jgi:hypothetical protein
VPKKHGETGAFQWTTQLTSDVAYGGHGENSDKFGRVNNLGDITTVVYCFNVGYCSMPQQPRLNDLPDEMKKKCCLKVFRCPQVAVKTLGLVLGLTTIMAVSGCSKKPTPTVDTTPTQSAPDQPVRQTVSVQPQEQPVVVQAPQSQAIKQQPAATPSGPDLAEINRSLIRWIVRNRRAPANFQEFASSAGAPIPPAPAGKKYIIGGNMHVQLVNQ